MEKQTSPKAMVTLIVLINTLIALILLYIAWQIWQLRLKLAGIADTLIAVERSTRESLQGAPTAIRISQLSIHQLRQKKEPLQVQLQQFRQVISLLGLGQSLWQRFSFTEVMTKRSLLKRRSKQTY